MIPTVFAQRYRIGEIVTRLVVAFVKPYRVVAHRHIHLRIRDHLRVRSIIHVRRIAQYHLVAFVFVGQRAFHHWHPSAFGQVHGDVFGARGHQQGHSSGKSDIMSTLDHHAFHFLNMVLDETTEAVKNQPTPSPSGCTLVLTLAGAPNMGLLPDEAIMLYTKYR